MTLEVLAVAALLSVSGSLLFGKRMGRLPSLAIMGALYAMAAAGLMVVAAHRAKGVSNEETVRDRPRRQDTDGYVGSESCRACHPSEYASWHTSYHRTMTQIAGPNTITVPLPAQLPGDPGWEGSRIVREGNTFVAELSGPVAEAYFRGRPERRPVVMTTGSHHYQAYWLAAPDYAPPGANMPLLFPFIYLFEERTWIPRHAAFVQPRPTEPDLELGRWNRGCIKCHSTHGIPERPAGDLQGRVVEFGIACEACHGPAAEHVERNRNPLGRMKRLLGFERDNDLVNPADLPPDRASAVCGRCHSIFEHRSPEAEQAWLPRGFRFRPGDNLEGSDIWVLQFPEDLYHSLDETELAQNTVYFRNRFWDDGAVRIVGREYNGLLKSPCYQTNDDARRMSCLSCHALHRHEGDDRAPSVWADDQLKPGMRGNPACTQCHDGYGTPDALKAHTHHDAGIVAANECQNCHMPYTTFGLLKGVRNHTVESPNVTTTVRTGRPNGCNQCHLDRTLAWTAAQLDAWYGIDPPTFTPDQAQIAAAALWAVQGSADQRALAAWAFGWDAARQASGSSWMTPYLGQLLDDPYYAVRIVAKRTLRKQPGFADFDLDLFGDDFARKEGVRELYRSWQVLPDRDRNRPELLLDADGSLDQHAYRTLAAGRDQRPIVIAE